MIYQPPTVNKYSFEKMLNQYGYLLYTCVGNSMLPFLHERKDIIEIHKKDTLKRCKRYDVVLYKSHEKYYLHRILKVRPNDYVICGDNNIRREYGITDDMILGIMTRVIRGAKTIYPTDWKYRLYVHFWCDCYYVRALILYVIIIYRAVRFRLRVSTSTVK